MLVFRGVNCQALSTGFLPSTISPKNSSRMLRSLLPSWATMASNRQHQSSYHQGGMEEPQWMGSSPPLSLLNWNRWLMNLDVKQPLENDACISNWNCDDVSWGFVKKKRLKKTVSTRTTSERQPDIHTIITYAKHRHNNCTTSNICPSPFSMSLSFAAEGTRCEAGNGLSTRWKSAKKYVPDQRFLE